MVYLYNGIKFIFIILFAYFLLRKSERIRRLERSLAFFGSLLVALFTVSIAFAIIEGFIQK